MVAKKGMTKLLIFTDLDGTLLDHETYSYEPARPALEAIKARSIPLIFATSKTASEISALFPDLELSWPAIVENGAGIWRPEKSLKGSEEQTVPGSIPYSQILDMLDDLPSNLRDAFTGFSNLNVQEIADLTGLALDAARRAKARDWSEPGLWRGSEEDFKDFRVAVRSMGLTVIKGGRFVHVLANTNKAEQMAVLTKEFAGGDAGQPIVTAALGDAPNDRDMLEAADYGFVIPNPSGTPLPELNGENSGRIRRMDLPGPSGWNEAILDLLTKIDVQ